jgi:predicted RND superfamily exporter protein
MKTIVNNKILFLFFSFLFSLPFILKAPQVETVDNVDYFNVKDNPESVFYDKIKKEFGNDEFFIISYSDKNFFSYRNLQVLKRITAEIEALDGIRDVTSLANVDSTKGEKDFFIVEAFLDKIPDVESELNDLKEEAVSNPLYEKNLISSDGMTGAIVVFVNENNEDPGYRKELIGKVNKILRNYEGDTGKFFLAGWTVTNLALSQYMKQDMSVFIPATYFFIVVCVYFFFRSALLAFIALVNISLCMGSTMGLFSIFGITLNNITVIVPPVVMALSLCDTVHVLSHLDKDLMSKFSSKEKAVLFVMKKLFLPCFLTSLTTGIGFASLYASDVPPIRDFAVIASLGMFFEFFFAFVFLPAFLLLFPEDRIFQDKKKSMYLNNILDFTSRFVLKKFKFIFISGVLLIFASIYFALDIRVETNLLEYFKKSSPVTIANEFVEERLAGISTVDISLEAVEDDFFKEPENLRVIEEIQKFSENIEGVDKTMSFVDFIKDMNKSFHNEDKYYLKIPESKELISQYLLIYDSDDIKDYIDNYYRHARLSLRLSKHSTKDQKHIINELSGYIRKFDSADLKIKVTGRAVQDVLTIDSLVDGQVKSLLIAAIIISVIMFFVLKSFMLGCLSIVPNIFPIAMNFGLMGVFNVPLNTATALIAAVAIGIAVDDTIHFITELKYYLKKGCDPKKAIHFTIMSKGKAIILSSVILSIGLGVMVLSSFVPTVNFGVLSAVIMLNALIGDLFILPAFTLMVAERKMNLLKLKEVSNNE